MTEGQIRAIAREEIQRQSSVGRFGMNNIKYHIHNGIDSPNINEDDVLNGTKNNSLLVMNVNEVFYLTNVKNIGTITFHGFAANNASGGGATQRAIVNGTVLFGSCMRFEGSGQSISVDTPTSTPFTQSSSSMYVDNVSQRVSASSEHFAYVLNSSGTIVATAAVVSVDGDSIGIRVELSSGWQITGAFLLS